MINAWMSILWTREEQVVSREFWAIIGTGISLGVLIVALAAFLVTGSNSINARLDSMDARFASIDSR